MVEQYEYQPDPNDKTESQVFFVAIDGSQASEDAFQVVRHGLWRDHKDQLVVGHIRNNKKSYLPYNLRPDYLKELYGSKIISIHKDWARYVAADVGEKTTKEALWELANEQRATAIVTGMHGRKGLKE